MTGLPPGYAPPEEIVRLAGGCDYADHYAISSAKGIRTFLASFFSFRPAWVKGLFALRKHLVWMLGLGHPNVGWHVWRPEEIPFTSGGKVGFFQVASAREGEYWACEADDVHLRAVLAVTREPGEQGKNLYRMMTFVTYKNWRGPVYFTIIRPFHHLVLVGMLRAAV